MSVAGQNMANVNNPAYADETDHDPGLRPGWTPPPGEEGTGADVVSITEVRDHLLDSQIRLENSVTGSYTAQQSALQNAECYLGEQAYQYLRPVRRQHRRPGRPSSPTCSIPFPA